MKVCIENMLRTTLRPAPNMLGLLPSLTNQLMGVTVEEVIDCAYSGWRNLYFSYKGSSILIVKISTSFEFYKKEQGLLEVLYPIAYHLNILLNTSKEDVPLIMFDEHYKIFKNLIRCKLGGTPIEKTQYPADDIILE